MNERKGVFSPTREDIARYYRLRTGNEPSTFYSIMYEALWKAYKNALSQRGVTHSEAIRIAIDSPAPRFWISTEKASLQIFRKECGKEFTYCEGTKNRRIMDIVYDKYLKLRQQPMHRDETRYHTVCWAVISQAPSFFISYRRARLIIETINHGIRHRL